MADKFGEWKDRLSGAAEDAQDKAGEMIDRAKDSQTGEQMGDAVQNAKDKARESYENFKNERGGQ
ncbi:hypothetical protein [Glycomyces arizonensis]|uniref:hypothetical protein n=1 Tax=Glycomyces arizonensis TaxID=256035 RepID=UPI0012EB7F59|nr:hypothetical protein [Glycomyces arizonensis]